ncbi:MAG: hypothetical protein N2652_04545 [Kiritimatiellae bacterium]|nr:hypothetical protein [Kiritimatiellia bacterium]
MSTRQPSRWPALAVALATMGALAQLQPGGSATAFRVPDYDEEGRLRSQLSGERVTMLTPDILEVEQLQVEMFRDGVVETRISSPHCLYNRRAHVAMSTAAVRIVRGDVMITGADYRYEPRRQRFLIQTNARVVIRDVRKLALPGARPAAGAGDPAR